MKHANKFEVMMDTVLMAIRFNAIMHAGKYFFVFGSVKRFCNATENVDVFLIRCGIYDNW